MLGRIQIEPDDVDDLGGRLRIVGVRECGDSMGLEPGLPEDLMDDSPPYARGLDQASGRSNGSRPRVSGYKRSLRPGPILLHYGRAVDLGQHGGFC